MQRYREFGAALRRRYGTPLAETSGRGNAVELPLPRPAVVDRAILMEEITQGERIREYVLEGRTDAGWAPLARGQSIGHKRIERFPATSVSAVRLRVEKAIAEPWVRRLAVFEE